MMIVDKHLETKSEFKYWFPVIRRFSPDDPFFASGNIERELLAKQVALDLNEEEKQQLIYLEQDENRQVFCPIVGCGAHLKSLAEFEDHYNARHTASCSVCSRVYPTCRLLGIHVAEAHDSFFQAKVARGYPMYECLVEGCGLKLKSYKSRHQHLMDKHNFPSSFEFFKKSLPSKKERVKKNQRKQRHTKHTRYQGDGSSAMQVEEETPQKERVKEYQCEERQMALITDDEGSTAMQIEEETLNGLVSSVSRLTTSDSTPAAISFGRHHTRGLTFVPRSVLRETKK
uniref:zinc finger protein 511 n=1 Tax=Erigeron canadensis TaxID=72917 RepID=UPI001CB978FD|nr:zinc finger protein 511 [Erigeron canadensis]